MAKQREDVHTFASEPREIAARKKVRCPFQRATPLRNSLSTLCCSNNPMYHATAWIPAPEREAFPLRTLLTAILASQPKYREMAPAEGAAPGNIMYDKRVVRGNTYAAQPLPQPTLTVRRGPSRLRRSAVALLVSRL